MKKLFFTAIAMIAFSSASMANTIADEEVNLNDIKSFEKITKVEAIIIEKSCDDKAIDTYLEVIGDGPDNVMLLNVLVYLSCGPTRAQ